MKWNFAQLYANSSSSTTEWRLLLSRSWVYSSKQVGTAMAESFEDSSQTHTVPETSKYNHEKKTTTKPTAAYDGARRRDK